MKIKLDENIPIVLASLLSKMQHDVDTATQENLAGHEDDEIWKETQKAKRFLITQDLDFSDIRQFTPGTHYGILLLRLKDPNRQAIIHRISEIFEKEDVESWKSCFVVVSERKIRVCKTKLS